MTTNFTNNSKPAGAKLGEKTGFKKPVKKEIPLRLKQIFEVTDFLIAKFPNTFSKDPTKIKPLKIGIHNDIFTVLGEESPFSKKLIREAIGRYINSFAYNSIFAAESKRYDLEGNEVDEVDATQVSYHQDCKKQIQQKFAVNKSRMQNRAPKRSNFDNIKPKAVTIELQIGDKVAVILFNSEKIAEVCDILNPGKVKVKLENGIIIPVDTKILKKVS